ncbi:hypothetical protein LY474_16215 [Myxococcus stipitatus]|uniref:hypothetical protein n=1 Tax=Myxococcus stipitatus TaxID=83455 RepID=UPI001F1E496B|nr:hypothetical protein [Myxococcus stipitatus]MCE9669355.1 hypothetical protein [Myxococcus stipitatus]
MAAFELLRERLGEKPFELAPSWLDRLGALAGLAPEEPLPRRWQAFKQRHRLEPRPVRATSRSSR